MQIGGGRHFSYCLNVHPGESLDDMLEVIRNKVPDIKTCLSPESPFGLGLRIAKEASLELNHADNLDRLGKVIQEADCYAFTVNGFPFGAFHQTRVKEQVYQPDWSSPERMDYSRDLFQQLASLLPADHEGSISTVPLGYKFDPTAPQHIAFMAAQLQDLALYLHQLEQKTGSLLHLGLEPEPDCILETTQEAVSFFKEHLFRTRKVPEELLRRHLGICLDTCHVAMQFEDPVEIVKQLGQAGIRISKTQISAALECEADIDPQKLKPFDDGVYLHQIKSSSGESWRDIPDFVTQGNGRLAAGAPTLRIHAHVPLHWQGDQDLRSTRHTLTPDFWKALEASDCKHLEVETYTFDVLPESLRAGRTVTQNMIAECKWALGEMEVGGYQ